MHRRNEHVHLHVTMQPQMCDTCTCTCQSMHIEYPQQKVHGRRHFFIVWSFHYPKSRSLSLSRSRRKLFQKNKKERESDRWTHAVGKVELPLHYQDFDTSIILFYHQNLTSFATTSKKGDFPAYILLAFRIKFFERNVEASIPLFSFLSLHLNIHNKRKFILKNLLVEQL